VPLLLELALTRTATGATRAEDTVAEGVLVNTGTEPLEVDLVELTSPSLALEVVDDKGRPVLMPPPPTPGRPEMIAIAPGGRRSVSFRAVVPSSAPAGRYRVRLRYGEARSRWVDLEIAL
jgi:uncharacterized membrane protein